MYDERDNTDSRSNTVDISGDVIDSMISVSQNQEGAQSINK